MRIGRVQAGGIQQHQLLAQTHPLQGNRGFCCPFLETFRHGLHLPIGQTEEIHAMTLTTKAVRQEITQGAFTGIKGAKHQQHDAIAETIRQLLRWCQCRPGSRPGLFLFLQLLIQLSSTVRQCPLLGQSRAGQGLRHGRLAQIRQPLLHLGNSGLHILTGRIELRNRLDKRAFHRHYACSNVDRPSKA